MKKLFVETLEFRRLLSWSGYSQLVNQDDAASEYSSVTGAGVTVAVIDTGIDYTLSQLGGGIGSNYKVLGGYDFYSNDSDPMDGSGHGTNVASVIAAKPYTVGGVTYQGVAPDAKLVALRVGTEDSISNANIERALQWVIANYQTYNISVVNLSLGSGSYTDVESGSQFSDEFATLADLGIFVTAASGNSNDSSNGPISADGIAYPAADPNVFAVGAVSASDVITSWSQRGDELDLLAPGEDIVALKMGGGTESVDGTSFASPYVAGAAALIKQADPTAKAGDIGSILMTSGTDNRDGVGETGNTTTLQFSRLDIDAALDLTFARVGKSSDLDMGTNFSTALDSQGVLHAAWYDAAGGGRLLYATRNTAGLWSAATVVDASGDVGAMPSIAVDSTGKAAVAYFDLTNTSVKYADYNAAAWSSVTLESEKHVGTNPSLEFDIDGNAYVAYYKRSGGNLRLAMLDRDAGTWSRSTVDGADGTDTGATLSLDVGEAAVRSGFGFTVYDTTVAIAYADTTNGDLKYSRLDVDNSAATWYTSVVDDLNGVSNITLDLHDGFLGSGQQAQIVYQDTSGADVKYAYRNTDWFTEPVLAAGKVGDYTQIYFDSNDNPIAVFFDRTKKALYAAERTTSGTWSNKRVTTGAGAMSVALNQRTDHAVLSWLNRPKTDVFSTDLI